MFMFIKIHDVVRSSNQYISHYFAENDNSSLKVLAARATRLFFLIQPIILLISWAVIDVSCSFTRQESINMKTHAQRVQCIQSVPLFFLQQWF